MPVCEGGGSRAVTHQEGAPPCPAPPSHPHHPGLVFLWSSLLRARHLGPRDHRLCFFMEDGPEKKATADAEENNDVSWSEKCRLGVIIPEEIDPRLKGSHYQ